MLHAPKNTQTCAKVFALWSPRWIQALKDARHKGDEAHRLAADSELALQESRAAEKQVRQLLNDMRTASQKAATASSSIFSGIRELGQNMENVDRDVVHQREKMQDASQAIEQINSAIQSIALNTVKAADDAALAQQGGCVGRAGGAFGSSFY